jgi:RPA family protein
MAFEIIAERESEIVRMQRNSSLMAVAKARVFADEGWTVTVVVAPEEASIVDEELAPSLVTAQAFPALTFEPQAA